jgi:hypothetical protein
VKTEKFCINIHTTLRFTELWVGENGKLKCAGVTVIMCWNADPYYSTTKFNRKCTIFICNEEHAGIHVFIKRMLLLRNTGINSQNKESPVGVYFVLPINSY